MSDRMIPIPFEKLLNRIIVEKERHGTVFGIKKPYVYKGGKPLRIFDRDLENPYGAAAGPHTQLAQNLAAAYYTGARFFELKTVQTLDGEDLPVAKPCIEATDEGYNVEWSTELRVEEALDEYVKGWFLCSFLAVEYGLGSIDGFAFNMSVGYDLEGIKSSKIDRFIEGLKDASNLPVYKECIRVLKDNMQSFKKFSAADLEAISPHISNSVTLSTLHGCPPATIEEIGMYLLEEKSINTYIKCNPTLLKYERVRKILDDNGFDYISFDDHHFKNDLQFEDAVPMIKRLKEKAELLELAFGVKLTNTFPVKIARGELPGEDMYMSGRSLFPLSIAVAQKLSDAFDGNLNMSFSGGADEINIVELYEAGIWPITVATVLLKTGGYTRGTKLASLFDNLELRTPSRVDKNNLDALVEQSLTDPYYKKETYRARKKSLEPKSIFCKVVCGACEGVCPNRANTVVKDEVSGKKLLVHVDDMCNECGNCTAFCPYGYVPYKDKLTVFSSEDSVLESTNQGFVAALDDLKTYKLNLNSESKREEVEEMIKLILDKYEYLI